MILHIGIGNSRLCFSFPSHGPLSLCILFPQVAELAMNTLDTWPTQSPKADTLQPLRAPKVHILVQTWDSPHEGEPVGSNIKCFHQLSSFIILVQEFTGVQNASCSVLLKWHGRKAISTVRKCTSSCVTFPEGAGMSLGAGRASDSQTALS